MQPHTAKLHDKSVLNKTRCTQQDPKPYNSNYKDIYSNFRLLTLITFRRLKSLMQAKQAENW